MKTCILFALTFAIVDSTFAQPVLYCAGTVHYPSGAPAPGARVQYYPGHHNGAGHYTEVRTGPDGQYEITGPKDPSIYTGIIDETNSIMARDVEQNLAAIQECHMRTTNVDLVLQPAITLSGSVKNEEGEPIAGAELDFGFWARSFHKLEARRTRVDESGKFSIPALPQGRAYEIFHIDAKGYGSGNASVPSKDTRTSRYEFPTFVLQHANLKIAGRVLNDAGKTLAGVEVYFMGKGQRMNPADEWPRQPFCNTQTDSEGRFSFDTVCDAPLRVYASHHGGLLNGGGGIPAQPGDTNIVIRFPAPDREK
jgi:hypothetical protein